MKLFQLPFAIFALTSAFYAQSEIVTTSAGSYMMEEYNLAPVEQSPDGLWLFYSGSGALMTHAFSSTSTAKYELTNSPYTYMSYFADNDYLRGHPMNNGSVGIFLLAPVAGTYDISSSLWKIDSGTIKYSIYNDEVITSGRVSGTTGVHNGNYSVDLEQGEKLFFDINSYGGYERDTFFLDLSVTYDNGLSHNASATANDVSSPIIGGALLSLLAGAFFMRERKI
jgi:hypothetical protein